MTQNTTTTDEPTIADAATDLSDSFEEMGEVTEELSVIMDDLAKNFESLGDATGSRATPKTGPSTTSSSGFAAADD